MKLFMFGFGLALLFMLGMVSQMDFEERYQISDTLTYIKK